MRNKPVRRETAARTQCSKQSDERHRFHFSCNFCALLVTGVLVFLAAQMARADINGSISGTVTDPSGAVVPNVEVTAVNTGTGLKLTVRTDGAGFYSFPELPIGTYDIVVHQTGFKEFHQTGIVIHANSAIRVDAKLQVGAAQEKVVVSSSAVHVETASTQMGEVITGSHIENMPLGDRGYTSLMTLQPGVAATQTGEYSSFQVGGLYNAGNYSISGMRESANGFMVNGGDVNEQNNMGTEVIPSLDSIAEFRILTNNFDAELGKYMGGQINLVTKSGTDSFHGEAFDYLRNTDFDAADFFDKEAGIGRGTYHRNNFGGNFGGPIVRNKVFFFGDYEGLRLNVPDSSGLIPVPSPADLTGNLSDVSSSLTGTVSSNFWATTLSNKLGYSVTAGEPYFTPGCTSNTTCVFPNAVIPPATFDPVSRVLLSASPAIIPAANVPGTNFFDTIANEHLRDDKFSARGDINSGWGTISAYYSYDNYNHLVPFLSSSLPYPTSTLGGFHQANVSDVKIFSSTVVNEFRINYTRGTNLPTPVGGILSPTSPLAAALYGSSGAFATPANGGLAVTNPALEGVPNVSTLEFSFGVNPYTELQFDNTYQIGDNFTKIKGTHTMKFGAAAHLSQINIFDHGANNGTFSFNGQETGDDFADFLLGTLEGFSSGFNQGEQVPMYTTSRYFGLYGQDSWRVRSNLTFNYGLRWEVTTPWYEKHNEIETIVPGENSLVFPGAPTGWVFPGDPNVPKTLGPTDYHNFGPRIGLAYSPSAEGGFFHKLFGSSGQSSIRAGYGIFYTAFEDATSFNEVGDAPFGFFYTNPDEAMFSAPFIDIPTGLNFSSPTPRFPVPFPPLNVSRSNPDSNVNWVQFEPITSSPGFFYKNRVPYAEQYMLSFQRQLEPNTMLSLSYVGNQGHHLLADLDSNPANPALCEFLSNPANLDSTSPFSTPCAILTGPSAGVNAGEDGFYQLAPGVTPPAGAFVVPSGQSLGNDTCPSTPSGPCIVGTRVNTPAALLGSNGWFTTFANSNYNALEISLKHNSKRAAILASYTFSKAIDNASSWGPGIGDAAEEVNPVNFRLSRGLASFDMRHNFVVSYSYELPFDKLLPANRFTGGWIITGITHFHTGLPVIITEQDDRSLLGTGGTGPTGSVVDTPNVTKGPLFGGPANTNPRSGQPYFNISLFSPEAIGQIGNANRRFFHGPGSQNWDMGLLKDTSLTERMKLEFRAEFYNVFNHANFNNPQGDFIASDFGMVTGDNGPRIGQLALKFIF